MLMKYFGLIVFLLPIITVVAGWMLFQRRLKRRFYRQAFTTRMYAKLRAQQTDFWFCTDVAYAAADMILKTSKQQQKNFLTCLENGKEKEIEKFLAKHNPLLATGFIAHFNGKAGLRKFSRAGGKGRKTGLSFLIRGLIHTSKFEFDRLAVLLNKSQPKKLTPAQKAVYKLMAAKSALYQGDLQKASKYALATIPVFKKKRFWYEMADAYFLLGEIYRVSTVYDVSQTMFRQALKIFAFTGDQCGQAASMAAQGMVLTAQERFAEATDYFENSLKLYQACNCLGGRCDVLNQLALIQILAGETKSADKYLRQALKLGRSVPGLRALALSRDLLSLQAAGEKKYQTAARRASQAQKLYLENHNFAAYLDALFTEAQAWFELGQYDKAEKICCKILSFVRKKAVCFHLGTVYSLLGQIELSRQNLSAAKEQFKLAFRHEKRDARLSAAAIDCYNLSLISELESNPRQAVRYFKIALECARQSGDDALVQTLKTMKNNHII